jgi:hypothetical protein
VQRKLKASPDPALARRRPYVNLDGSKRQ